MYSSLFAVLHSFKSTNHNFHNDCIHAYNILEYRSTRKTHNVKLTIRLLWEKSNAWKNTPNIYTFFKSTRIYTLKTFKKSRLEQRKWVSMLLTENKRSHLLSQYAYTRRILLSLSLCWVLWRIWRAKVHFSPLKPSVILKTVLFQFLFSQYPPKW